MWIDIVIGLFSGLLQGFFTRSFYTSVSKHFLLLILNVIKKGNLSIFLANIVALVLLGIYFLSVLLLKPVISIWDKFLIAWIIGLCFGGLLSTLYIGKRKNIKVISRFE